MLIKELTAEEWQLIEALRNYRRAYPNGARMLKVEITTLVDELMEIDYKEEEEETEGEN